MKKKIRKIAKTKEKKRRSKLKLNCQPHVKNKDGFI